MSILESKPVYQALMLPNEALDKGGIEILRAGLIDGELYVTARRTFRDPSEWGEVLADIARRLALLYSAEGEFEEAEAVAMIESAFAADMGAPKVRKRAGATAAVKRKAPPRERKKTAAKSAPKRTKGAKRTMRSKPRKS